MVVSAGLRVGSKFIILIFGIHPSVVSSPPALAVRFLLREGGEEEDGDEEDMFSFVFEDAISQIEDEMAMFLSCRAFRFLCSLKRGEIFGRVAMQTKHTLNPEMGTDYTAHKSDKREDVIG